MKIKRVKEYKQPNYATREMFALQPELLTNYIPPRWLKSQAVMGALIAFVLCGTEDSVTANPAEPQKQAANPDTTVKRDEMQKQTSEVKIAPVFIHGNGTGATGCIVLAPPMFLSESEAIELILNELKKENIVFDKKNVPVPDLSVEENIPYAHLMDSKPGPIKNPVEFIGYNTKYNLGFLLVSRNNYYKLGGKPSTSTLQDWDFLKLAYQIKEQIRSVRKVNAIVFYDPLVSEPMKYQNGPCTTQIECASYAKELLLLQVQDFITWYKTEITTSKR